MAGAIVNRRLALRWQGVMISSIFSLHPLNFRLSVGVDVLDIAIDMEK